MATVTETAAPAQATPQAGSGAAPQAQTDGFHLVIDALKLNGIDTIYGLPGIPITDLTRKAQAGAQSRNGTPAGAGVTNQIFPECLSRESVSAERLR